MNADVLTGSPRSLKVGVMRTFTLLSWCATARLVYERYFAGEDTAWGTPLGPSPFMPGSGMIFTRSPRALRQFSSVSFAIGV
jgi:hypothetical protein